MNMLRCIRQFFADNVGEFSCMRLMCFMVDATVLGMWVWGCFKAGAYIPLGYDAAGLIGAAHGTKAAQSRFEYGGVSSISHQGAIAPVTVPSLRNLEEGRD